MTRTNTRAIAVSVGIPTTPCIRTAKLDAVCVFTGYANRGGLLMGRMDHDPSSRVSFGCPDELLETLDEIAEREDKNRSEKLRELVRKEVEAKGDLDGPQPVLPDSGRLAEAYRLLHERASTPHKSKRRVKLETVKNKLHDNSTPKSAVLDETIKPLESEGTSRSGPGTNTSG